jgi:hypothetical protein
MAEVRRQATQAVVSEHEAFRSAAALSRKRVVIQDRAALERKQGHKRASNLFPTLQPQGLRPITPLGSSSVRFKAG